MMGNSRIFTKWTILLFAFAASEVLAGIDSRNIFEAFTKAEQISTDWRDDSYLTYVIGANLENS